jgi:chemotaxis protein histidine kinase CheA
VERVLGQKEVVVSALRDPLIQVSAISGATELGDGKAVLILDGTALTRGTVRPPEREEWKEQEQEQYSMQGQS